ncbi:PTS sugar transporter subunit IIA, partial [Staphylococcus auricularis]
EEDEDTSVEVDKAEADKVASVTDDIIHAPATGELVPISEVPDQVFAQKMMGDGVAIIPEKGTIVAPFDGVVKTVFPTKHAIGLESESGVEMLIHIGIDTVKLQGEGFDSLVEENETVAQGQPLMQIDLDYVKAHAPSIVTPLVFTNLNERTLADIQYGQVKLGQPIVTVK